jgi:hypothetical protein
MLRTWKMNSPVGYLNYRDGQIAYEEGEEYGKHHLCDAPLISFRLQFTLFFGFGFGGPLAHSGRMLSHPALGPANRRPVLCNI